MTELSRMCGVSREAVRQWVAKGLLEVTERAGNEGRYPRFSAEAVSRACVSGKLPALTTGWLKTQRKPAADTSRTPEPKEPIQGERSSERPTGGMRPSEG